MPIGPAELNAAISALAEALHAHAAAALDGAPPTTTVPLGVVARDAAEAYGQVLMAATGWSNPIGHLRGKQRHPSELRGKPKRPVQVRIDYQFDIEDPGRLVEVVQNRFGDDTIADVAEALRATIAADGWDPASYLGPLVAQPAAKVSVHL